MAALPDLLEQVAAGLRAGAAPVTAMADAAGGAGLPEGLGDDVATVVRRAERDGYEAALQRWVSERPCPSVASAAGALCVAAEAGGPAAPALEGLATGLRNRHDTAAEVAALSAQARMSAVVVGAAPVVSLALSVMADERVAPTLFGTGPGRAGLAAGITLETLAALWMRRIVRCEL